MLKHILFNSFVKDRLEIGAYTPYRLCMDVCECVCVCLQTG